MMIDNLSDIDTLMYWIHYHIYIRTRTITSIGRTTKFAASTIRNFFVKKEKKVRTLKEIKERKSVIKKMRNIDQIMKIVPNKSNL